MKNVFFSDSWELFFDTFGLRSFDDFFDSFEGSQVNANSKRSVLVRTFERKGQSETIYLKRFFDPHYKDMFFALWNWGGLCTQARLEWNSAHYLIDHGIAAYQPVCFGQDTWFGIERRSFFMTRRLPGQCLMDFVGKNWKSMSAEDQARLLTDLAGFVRKIHSLQISLPDLYIHHLYIDSAKAGPDQFAVIDLHRMSSHVPAWRMPACRVENLARLSFSFRDTYFSAEQKESFLCCCLNDLNAAQIPAMLDKIVRRGRQIALRRKQLKY